MKKKLIGIIVTICMIGGGTLSYLYPNNTNNPKEDKATISQESNNVSEADVVEGENVGVEGEILNSNTADNRNDGQAVDEITIANTETTDSNNISRSVDNVNVNNNDNNTYSLKHNNSLNSNNATNNSVSNNNNTNITTTTSSNFMNQIEELIFNAVNAERAKVNLSPLAKNSILDHYARVKSQDMGDRGYFDHSNLEGKYISDIMKADGIIYTGWAENIAYISGSTDSNYLAEKFMTNWMNSSGHRANILSSNYTSIGIGVYNKNGKVYATQEFFS